MVHGQPGGSSPIDVTHYLKGIDFPASKSDLLEQAKKNDAGDEVLDMIDSMPEDDYGDMSEVMHAYGEADREEDGEGGGNSREAGRARER